MSLWSMTSVLLWDGEEGKDTTGALREGAWNGLKVCG
jgi:hypothetical protein